jgi:hypothetical protein
VDWVAREQPVNRREHQIRLEERAVFLGRSASSSSESRPNRHEVPRALDSTERVQAPMRSKTSEWIVLAKVHNGSPIIQR